MKTGKFFVLRIVAVIPNTEVIIKENFHSTEIDWIPLKCCHTTFIQQNHDSNGNNRGLHFYYDEPNLPVQIGDNEYLSCLFRPSGKRERRRQHYNKKVGTVEEYYIMDANLTAGVFSGTGPGQLIGLFWDLNHVYILRSSKSYLSYT